MITALLAQDILAKVRNFLGSLDTIATDRALSWAYLHETESSFAIERESPSPSKAEAFVALLRQAHEPRPFDETYLVELHNAVLTNPLERAHTYRTHQNWLRGPLRGAAGITYLPPPPEWVPDLVDEVLGLVNHPLREVDPLVSAAIASFGFVFIHPFMDGNGRLSRFLFHAALCRSGAVPHGALLPVSVAMKRNEQDYLKALQSFSVPMRKHWEVRWIGEDDYHFRYLGDDQLYRYWDATACVEFGLEMARQALEQDLREETEFLVRFDGIYRKIDEGYDVRGSDLTTLIIGCLQNQGKVSNNRRKQYGYRVPAVVFDAIETACQATADDLADEIHGT